MDNTDQVPIRATLAVDRWPIVRQTSYPVHAKVVKHCHSNPHIPDFDKHFFERRFLVHKAPQLWITMVFNIQSHTAYIDN